MKHRVAHIQVLYLQTGPSVSSMPAGYITNLQFNCGCNEILVEFLILVELQFP